MAKETKEEILNRLSKELNDLDACFNFRYLNEHIVFLSKYIKRFQSSEIDLATFKNSCKARFDADTFQDLKKRSLSFIETVQYALVYILRSFFRLFDLIITTLNRAPHTMAETPGRQSFFEYPNIVGRRVTKLSNEFEQAFEDLATLALIK